MAESEHRLSPEKRVMWMGAIYFGLHCMLWLFLFWTVFAEPEAKLANTKAMNNVTYGVLVLLTLPIPIISTALVVGILFVSPVRFWKRILLGGICFSLILFCLVVSVGFYLVNSASEWPWFL